MNASFGVRLSPPERYIDSSTNQIRVRSIVNVPVDQASDAQKKEAVSLRIVCKGDEVSKARALLMSAKAKLGYEGEIKEGTFRDGSTWLTLGRRPSVDNVAALEAMLG